MKQTNSVYVPLRIGKTTNDNLEKLSKQTKKSRSELIREFIDKGLSVDSFEADEQRMLLAIRQAVAAELERPVERLAAITAKGTHTAAASYFTLIEVLKLLVNEQELQYVPQLAAKARRLGIAYLKEKPETIETYLEETILSIMKQ